jgi:hypothetical protein
VCDLRQRHSLVAISLGADVDNTHRYVPGVIMVVTCSRNRFVSSLTDLWRVSLSPPTIALQCRTERLTEAVGVVVDVVVVIK